jgi:hypothetical protein
MMRVVILSLLITAIPTTGLPETVLDGFDARYRVRWGPLSGSVTTQLQATQEPGIYEYSVTSKARGLAGLFRKSAAAERSRFRLSGGRPQPLEYSRSDGKGESEGQSTVSFDWQTRLAHSVHEGQPAELDMETGMHDRLTADVAAMMDLRAGNKLNTYHLVDRNTIRSYEFRHLGTETVEEVSPPATRIDAQRHHLVRART